MSLPSNGKPKDRITRSEALKRMGKYAALTAVGSFLILNPQKSQAQSAEPPGGGGAPI